ncbi:translation elongation factor EF-1 subunit alpha [Candidatus Micrarchaeota archaeon CG11_big_fil_rev_8_21_14_0_20_47_5]|nr:MAG: translation elongation factor EF-1 subunit alpha [Candidatus Micrarchaeota archaeon CG1_02_47_40]PIN84242.1 MAG: translation elongation factor EF-1 subunit alpha [Candidatus Micrarchaeota archaeon CG11_big_fil_rev_8_21_14_0_20_47_5]
MAEKEHLNLIFIGHVDHGKSTTVGRVLYDTGALSEQDLRRLKEEAAKVGKATFEFAFTMDTLKEERERGVTIDLSHKEFQTPKFYFTIIDAPGHRDFVKNMITGASQADAAVLVVSVKEGLQPQTKEHAFLAKVLGIPQIIVAINKMDAVNNDHLKFDEVKSKVAAMLKNIGYNTDKIPFIPISGYHGTNIAKKSPDTSWYVGPTLVESFDKLDVPKKPTDKPLRLPIQDVFTITGHGTVPVGRVETGIMKVNDSVIFMPSGAKGEVKSIEMHHQQLQQAVPGDNVGFNVKNVDKKDVRRGEVVGPASNPPTVAAEFTAQIVVLEHPTAIAKGYTPVFHLHTAQVACTVVEILEKKDPKTGQVQQKNPDFIKTGDVAIIKVKPLKPVVVEKFQEFPPLGRFAIRDMGQTVAAGVVLEVVKKQQ